MKHYINNLLPRIREFSANLDKKEIFVDSPWVIVDENQNQQKYIFQRNGELIMSLNGQVTIGKWSYLSQAKSLLIDRIVDKILLNQNFVDPSVMILSKDGSKEDNLVLANEVRLPNLDVLNYLQKLFYTKNSISLVALTNGTELELYNNSGYLPGSKVTIDGEPVADGVLDAPSLKGKLSIKDSRIHRLLVRKKYSTNKGIISIEHSLDGMYQIGDKVFLNDEIAPDGRYKMGIFNRIEVNDGVIIKD